jgi:tetratricopeptide (TPR) repeat protein
MEDFLRLTKFLPFGEAYETWSSRANQSVRKYALQREIEMLSPLAKDVLQTCSLARAALTLVELQRVLGVHPDAILSAVDELTRLYLVPAPQLVEGIPRFHVNSNLAALVRDSISGSTRALELQNALRAVSGEALGRDDLVRDYCRQARVLSDASRHEDARRTMESALEKFPNHPRLLGVLGWVYRRWQPPKVVDARAAWQRAYELGSKARSTYVHWIGLESDEGDWHRAATAADKGLERCGEEDSLLLRTAGYAYTRYGRSLRNNLDEARAKSAFDKADHLLSTAVRRAHFEHASTDDLARTYRAWVHNADARRDQEAVCYRLGRWLDWNRRSPFLLEEARRHASLCPDIASSLEQEGRT